MVDHAQLTRTERRRQAWVERGADAKVLRGGEDLLDADVLEQMDRRDIAGLLQRLAERDGAELLVVPVVHRIAGEGVGAVAVVERRGRRPAVHERRDIGVRLERGTGLAGRDRVVDLATDVVVVVVGAAHHGQHLSRVRVHHQHGAVVDAIAASVAAHAVVNRLLRQRLRFRIQGGNDSQPASEQVTGIVALLKLVPDIVHEVWRQRGTVTERRLMGGREHRAQVLLIGLVRDGRGHIAVAHHRIQDVPLASAGVGEPFGKERIQVAGPLRQAGQKAGLRQVQLAGGGPKVRLRRGLDAK